MPSKPPALKKTKVVSSRSSPKKTPKRPVNRKIHFVVDFVLEFDKGIAHLPRPDINDLIAYGIADMDFVGDDGNVSILPMAKLKMTFVR